MTPADGAEVIVAKIAPIFLLLSLDIGCQSALVTWCLISPCVAVCCSCMDRGALCVVRDRDRHDHRDLYAIAAASVVAGLFRDAAVVDAFRCDDAVGSDTQLAATDHLPESGTTLRDARAWRDVEGRGN